MKPQGKLSIVATPIGNFGDITLRAIETLKNADVVILEERRQGTTLLKKLDIIPRDILALNEHNEETDLLSIIARLINGENMALMSDAGTPVFADPGGIFNTSGYRNGHSGHPDSRAIIVDGRPQRIEFQT